MSDSAYSPDGRKILFTGWSAAGETRIWLMGRWGANKRQLETGPGDSYQPAWSPDGSRFVFVKPTGEGSQLFIYTFASGRTRQLTVADGNGAFASEPAWSPGGHRIVFARANPVDSFKLEPVADLYWVRPNGTELTQLTNTPVNEASPNWAPGGGRIVYARMTAGNYRSPSFSLGLDIIRADGSNLVRFTRTGELGPTGGELEPSWSPDGRLIVAVRPRYGDVDAPAYDKPGLWKFRLADHGHGVWIRRGHIYSPDWGPRVPALR